MQNIYAINFLGIACIIGVTLLFIVGVIESMARIFGIIGSKKDDKSNIIFGKITDLVMLSVSVILILGISSGFLCLLDKECIPILKDTGNIMNGRYQMGEGIILNEPKSDSGVMNLSEVELQEYNGSILKVKMDTQFLEKDQRIKINYVEKSKVAWLINSKDYYGIYRMLHYDVFIIIIFILSIVWLVYYLKKLRKRNENFVLKYKHLKLVVTIVRIVQVLSIVFLPIVCILGLVGIGKGVFRGMIFANILLQIFVNTSGQSINKYWDISWLNSKRRDLEGI
jgi:hypothetical protein